MMFLFLTGLSALGASPAHADGAPVPLDVAPITIEWARPFHLSEAAPYDWMAGAPPMTDGMVVQLRVDPALLVPRQVGQAVLYLGATPIAIVNADTTGGCAVGYVMGSTDLLGQPLYVGSPELPERIDAAAGQRELAAARSAGATAAIGVDAARRAGGASLALADLRGVYGVLADRVAACSPQETSRIHTLNVQAGRPAPPSGLQ